MEQVLSWGAAALFIGPILAAIALMGLRWLVNSGYTLQALLLGAVGGYLAYRHFHPH